MQGFAVYAKCKGAGFTWDMVQPSLLTHPGRIMKDADPISEYHIQDHGFVVVMVSKAKAKQTTAPQTSEGAVSVLVTFDLPLSLLPDVENSLLFCTQTPSTTTSTTLSQPEPQQPTTAADTPPSTTER